MFTLATFAVVAALSAAPALEATPTVDSLPLAAELFGPEPAVTAAIPSPPPNCSVTCWSTGQTFYAYASTMTRCGNVGDEKCGVCNWDGYFNGILFANC